MDDRRPWFVRLEHFCLGVLVIAALASLRAWEALRGAVERVEMEGRDLSDWWREEAVRRAVDEAGL